MPVPATAGARTSTLLLVALALVLVAGAAGAAPRAPPPSAPRGYEAVERLLSPKPAERARGARELVAAADPSLIPGVVDTLFFIPKIQRTEALGALVKLSGENAGERYLDWVDVVMRHPEWRARDGYATWKATLFARIDRCFGDLLRARPARLRLEEVVFGGVGCEGIPALDGPRHGAANEGRWLADGDRVFGAAVGGESRAYPESMLSWHEMTNDVLGGQPVTLSYCTLCRSAILFAGDVGGRRLTFGTSGLLYRSNKLMIDRATRTLWHNLTGEAVLGPLAEGPAHLRMLPLTATTWGEWRRRHPETTVLVADRALERSLGYDYRPGAADAHRRGVRFPVGQVGGGLAESEEVYGLRVGPAAKAYPVAAVLAQGAVNDTLGDTRVVLLGERSSQTIRAYQRGTHTFTIDATGRPLDEHGVSWVLEESRLLAPDGERLERLPGTLAAWRGWFAFFPRTEIFRAPS